MPASVCILTKMLRSDWTGMISSLVILMASRGSARARLVAGVAALARSAASMPPMPMAAVFIQARRECDMRFPLII